MRFDRDDSSMEDIEDRRGEGPVGGGVPVFGILRFASMFGWKGILIGLVVAGVLAVGSQFMGGSGGGHAPPPSAQEDELARFVEHVFHDVQSSWRPQISGYQNAHLVLFRVSTRSGCGTARDAIGPFYCPNDQK